MSTQSTLPGAFSLFTPSMNAITRNLGTFLGLVLAPFAFFMVFGTLFGISGAFSTDAQGTSTLEPVGAVLLGIAIVLFVAVTLILAPAMTYFGLRSSKDKDVGFVEAVKVGLKYVWRYLGYSLLFGLLIFGGLLLLIVPGFIMFRRYFLAGYYIVDKDMKVLDAMRSSAADTKSRPVAVWGIVGVIILINLLGIVPILGQVASFVLSILYTFAPAVRYHQIREAIKQA